MSKKEQLSAKIDSEEKLAGIYGTSDPSIGSNWNAANRLERADGCQIYSTPWWLRREALRVTEGVYTTTQALDQINRSFASQHVVHVSNEDPTMVAYTHSTDDGLRDKQTRTTLGKFLRRTFILLTDNQIQTLEASHRAEMTGTFELATTAAAIRYTYTHMDGDSGCMRYQPLSFAIGNDRHPSEVYEAPGMGVAYTKDANGNIKSRSVVWVNPADPEDKRYVRVYGDPVLKSILVRAGYRCATLVGAKLAKIPYVPEYKTEPLDGYYVMPYLDGPGGEQSDHSGAYVALDGDWFTVMPRDEREVIENALGSGYTTSARSTSARVKVLELPASEFVSDLTGEKFEGYRHRKVNYMDGDTVKTCAYSECKGVMDIRVYTRHNGERINVQINGITTNTFYHGGHWLDNETNRAYCGHTRLSAHYYPDMRGWTDTNTYTVKRNGEDHIIRRGDAITLLGETEVTLVHRAETAVMRKLGFINASPDDLGGIVMISKKRATYRRSTGGTAFDTDFHTGKFVELITGGWSTKNSASRRSLFGSTVRVPTGYVLTEADRVKVFMALDDVKSADLMMASITPETEVGAIEASISVIKGTARRASVGSSSFWRVGSNADGTPNLRNRDFADITWDSQVELASFVRVQDVTGDDGYNKLEKFTYSTDVLRGTAANVETVKPWVDAHLATLKALIEQKAMEAAGQLRLLPDPPATITVSAISDERFALVA